MYDILFPSVQGTSYHVEALWMCMYWVWEAIFKASVVSHFVSCSLKSKGLGIPTYRRDGQDTLSQGGL